MFALLVPGLYSPNIPSENLKLRIEYRRKMATSDGARKLDATSSLHVAIHNAYARELAAALRGDDEDGIIMHKIKAE